MKLVTVTDMLEWQQVIHRRTLERIVRSINVGIVIQKESFMDAFVDNTPTLEEGNSKGR